MTTDGSDPRLLGGGISGSASTYQSGTVTSNLITSGAAGAVWKYLADGSNQGSAWRAPAFNDTAWSQGAGQLGYGESDETTVIPSGPTSNRYITSYFRHSFIVTDAGAFTSLNLGILRDDGAIVYLNGTEVARTNMPVGPIGHLTPATAVVSGADESTFFPFAIAPSALVEGTNVIAVEIHQQSGSSSDVSFDLRLSGEKTQTATPILLSPAGLHTVKTRLLNGGVWSALTEATFLVDTQLASAANLAITELHYHPADPSTAEQNAGFNSSGDFEFIELTNVGSQHIDLAGLAFTNGISFTFDPSNPLRILAPGASVLLVSSLAAFEFRYGMNLPVAGEFSGNLNNDGEQITLVDASKASVRDFIYNDAAPWPAGADGDGQSLVLINPGSNPDPNDPRSWRHSSASGGNPSNSDALDYATWKSGHGIILDESDDDNDGVSAFLEYVTGGDPDSPSANVLPTATIMPVNVGGLIDDYIVLEVRRRIGADDIAIIAQSSTELVTWPGIPVFAGSFANGDGTETLRYRSNAPAAGGARIFLRAEATLLP